MAALAFAAAGYAVSGFLIFQFGSRNVLVMSVIAMLASTLGTANSKSLQDLVVSQGVAGLSEGLFYVDALVILTNAFEPARIGRAFGVLEGALNVGILASLMTGAAIATMFGWRFAYHLLTALGVLTLLLIAIVYAEPVRTYQQTNLRMTLRDRQMSALFVPTALLFLAFWSFWAFVPTYLTDQLRMPLAVSGAISSLAFLLATFAALTGGLLADRLGPKRASVSVTATYAFFLVLFALTSNVVAAVLFLLIITFSQAFLIPTVLSFIPKRFPQAELGRTYGIVIALAYGAGAIGPVIVGRVTDAYGFVSAFLILAAGVGLTALLLLRSL